MSVEGMHISFFQFVPRYGGADRCTVEFAARLSKYVKVSIVDPFGSCEAYRRAVEDAGLDYFVLFPQDEVGDIGGKRNVVKRVVALAKFLPQMMKISRLTRQLYMRIKPDIILTHNFKSGMVLMMNRVLRMIPCCYYLHNWYRPPQMTVVGKWLLNNHASGVLGVSYATMQACICAGIPMNKLKALYNPIDVEEYQQRSEGNLDDPLPQINRSLKILLPAGLRRVKGHKIAIQAMSKILKWQDDAVLWIPGEYKGDNADLEYVSHLKREISLEGVSDHVEFIGHRNDLPQVMKNADVLILPSLYEGHPRVILEGMAIKKPFIGTPAGGTLDMLSPGLTGELIRFENSVDLAEAIIKVITNPERTSKMVERSHEWVCNCFTPEAHTKNMLKYCNEIVSKK